MNLFGVMDVSGSALRAERVRAEVVAANMANAETTRTANGGPYQRQHVVFSAVGAGQGFAETLRGQIAQEASGTHLATLGGGLDGQGGTAANGADGGVAVAGIVSDASAPLKRYDPGHPDADAQGFVAYPDINPLTEMVDLMGATRAYGMNASALSAEKSMITASLDILK